MADQKKRSDLIRSQIENLLRNAPQPYSQAEKDQIMKGRKGQAEIDKGRAAIEARNEEIRQFNAQIKILNDQLGSAETDERLAVREGVDTAAKQRYDEEASSGYGRAAQLGANAAALPAGLVVGAVSGKGINLLADRSQASKNERLQGVAKDRLAGVTTRSGAREGARLAGIMPSDNSVLRVGGRMLPHAIGGIAGAAKGGSMLANSFQGDDFYADMTNRAMGLGLIGSGVGIAQQGARYAVNPTVAPDAQALAIINSDQLRRNNGGARAPEAKAQTPRGVLVEQAKAAGIKNVGKKNMAQLSAAIEGAKKGLPKAGVLGPLAFPAAAGALAFGMTPSDAEASTDGGSVTGNDEALTNAGLAAGGTVLASRYAAPVLGALARASGPMTPFAAADITDAFAKPFVPDEKEYIGRNREIRAMPFLRHLTPGFAESYDMAQVPSAAPERRSAGPRRPGAPSSFEQALAEFQALISAQ